MSETKQIIVTLMKPDNMTWRQAANVNIDALKWAVDKAPMAHITALIDTKCLSFDFSADKRIDINNLHTEEQCHSEQCFRYNKRRSKLSGIVDQLEELKKQTRSRLINDCIANPALCDANTKKYSDKKAEAYYRLDSGYREVIDAFLKAKNELDCMAGMQRIIEDKRWQLKDLKDYSMSQYFDSKESKESRIVLDVQFETMDRAVDLKQKTKPVVESRVESVAVAQTEAVTDSVEQPDVSTSAGSTQGTNQPNVRSRSRRQRQKS